MPCVMTVAVSGWFQLGHEAGQEWYVQKKKNRNLKHMS